MASLFQKHIGNRKFVFEKVTDGNGDVTYYIQPEEGTRSFFMSKDEDAQWRIAHKSMVPEHILQLEKDLSDVISSNG